MISDLWEQTILSAFLRENRDSTHHSTVATEVTHSNYNNIA